MYSTQPNLYSTQPNLLLMHPALHLSYTTVITHILLCSICHSPWHVNGQPDEGSRDHSTTTDDDDRSQSSELEDTARDHSENQDADDHAEKILLPRC